MSEYIERSKVAEILDAVYENGWMAKHSVEAYLNTARKVLEILPGADVAEVKHGHWQYTDALPHWVCCSECHKKFLPNMDWIGRYDIPTNYCPHCGAKMDEEDEQ